MKSKNLICGFLMFFFAIVGGNGRVSGANPTKCLQIYYDHVETDPKISKFGRLHALHLDNLVGHFPHIQTYISPISKYHAGDIEHCDSSIYLGTYFDAYVPQSFVEDFVHTKKRVAWIGYNFWKLGDQKLKSLWGVQFKGLSTLDVTKLDPMNRPGFYRFYTYKGELFEKYGEFDRDDPKKFNAAFEIPLFTLTDPSAERNVLSWARHSSHKDDATPWALASQNKWYLGDSPFSFMIESDRYVIFCDILFDILDEQPRRRSGKIPALFRVEDVHPKVPFWQLYRMVEVLKKHNIPFSMTTVPIFSDPFGSMEDQPSERFVPMTRDKAFRDFLDYAKESRGTFIMHGVTHQNGLSRNPFTGATGDDFEFWDRNKNTPIDQDNVPYILNRLEDGLQLFDLVGQRPAAWTAPHYQASPLAYSIFGQVFSWSVGRMIYAPFQLWPRERLPENFTMDRSGPVGRAERQNYLGDMKVSFDQSRPPSGQFYPYEIYGDEYGQRVIPENVGNVQAFMNEQVFRTRSVDEIITDLRRNRVIRDTWGSFFIHPFCVNSAVDEGIGAFPGDVKEIERLIKTTDDLGYEFIDLTAWIKQHTEPIRKKTIEIMP